MIEIINESNFTEKVLDGQGKILVEFFATWCPHCQRVAPTVDRFAEDAGKGVTVYRVDVDQSPDLANQYAPQGFPTFVLFENGKIIQDATGEQTMSELESLVAA